MGCAVAGGGLLLWPLYPWLPLLTNGPPPPVRLQVVKAMSEAEKHKGVSLILAYAPCVMQGITEGMCGALDESKSAVDTGYWPLYRWVMHACMTGGLRCGHIL